MPATRCARRRRLVSAASLLPDDFDAADVLTVQKRYSDFLSCQLDVPKFHVIVQWQRACRRRASI